MYMYFLYYILTSSKNGRQLIRTSVTKKPVFRIQNFFHNFPLMSPYFLQYPKRILEVITKY